MAEKPTETSGKFDLATPPHAAVAKELKALGFVQDDRYPPAMVADGSGGARHWTEALMLMRRQAQAYQQLSRFQQTPFWRSPTFLVVVGGLVALGSVAITLITDPELAEWIPAPWNKVLPVVVTLGVVPRMQKWWQEYRRVQEAELADQRRAFAFNMAAEPPVLPPPDGR